MRHPLHPAVVHFPIACWSLAVAADFLGLYFGETTWQYSALLLAVGCGMAIVAMMAGLMELAYIPEGQALRDTHLHMGAMLAAFTLFTLSLLLRLNHFQPLPPNGIVLSLDVIGFLTLMFGGWLGGKLVYGHGIGQNPRPKSTDDTSI